MCIDPTLSKCAIVPGWVLAARTQSEASEYKMMNFEFKNEEICIKNDEICIQNDGFCR